MINEFENKSSIGIEEITFTDPEDKGIILPEEKPQDGTADANQSGNANQSADANKQQTENNAQQPADANQQAGANTTEPAKPDLSNIDLTVAKIKFKGTYTDLANLVKLVDENSKNIVSNELKITRKTVEDQKEFLFLKSKGKTNLSDEYIEGDLELRFFRISSIEKYVPNPDSKLKAPLVPKSTKRTPVTDYDWAAVSIITFNTSTGEVINTVTRNEFGVFDYSKSTGSSKSKSSSSQTSSKPKPAKKAKITFKSDGNTRGLDYFVNNYPSKQRGEARTYLKQMQDSFPQVARSVGIPTNDLSSGLAAAIAGAYMAYNNVSLNDDYMKPMQNQLKTVLQGVDAFDKMSDSDKKYIYDQMVIIGMTLTINQYQNQQNPNAKVTAQLRNAGKQVLEGLLGVSASKVKITSSGLVY